MGMGNAIAHDAAAGREPTLVVGLCVGQLVRRPPVTGGGGSGRFHPGIGLVVVKSPAYAELSAVAAAGLLMTASTPRTETRSATIVRRSCLPGAASSHW